MSFAIPKTTPSSVTFGDLLQVKDIADFKSCEDVYCGSKEDRKVKINDNMYELRMFFFQGYDGTFEEFVKNEKLEKIQGGEADHGYATLTFFSPTEEQRKKGYYYLVSLKKVSPKKTS